MESIELKRPVMIKVIMTENFRNEVVGEAQLTIKQLEENLKTLETRANSASLTSPEQNQSLMIERERILRMKAELEWKIKEVQNVAEGAELPFRVFEGPVVIKKGDNFVNKISRAEITLKDWEVVDIRE